MIFREYGAENRDAIILLHGGGLSWWTYRDAAELLSGEYRVILPILDGHAGSDRHFTSIEDNAEEIVSFIDECFGGSVPLIGGLSLGGQVLVEMLSKRGDICRHALIESAAVIPSKLTNALIAPTFGPSWGLVKNRSFSEMQFLSLRIRPDLFEEYYRDTCLIEKADMIAFMKANTAYALKASFGEVSADAHIYYGEKETRVIRRSAEAMRGALPSCAMHPLPGSRHGEFSINSPGLYADAVRRILCGEKNGDPGRKQRR